jgi:hypothetical protein
VQDYDSPIKDVKFSFAIGDGCDSNLFGDDAFAVTGKGADRVIVHGALVCEQDLTSLTCYWSARGCVLDV